jgi:hypothetical protein
VDNSAAFFSMRFRRIRVRQMEAATFKPIETLRGNCGNKEQEHVDLVKDRELLKRIRSAKDRLNGALSLPPEQEKDEDPLELFKDDNK